MVGGRLVGACEAAGKKVLKGEGKKEWWIQKEFGYCTVRL